jgi:ribonuclease T2
MNDWNGLRLIIWTTLVSIISTQFEDRGKAFQCLRDREFDFLLLSLQWPTSYCLQKQRCNKNKRQNDWQIHGLWPQLLNGFWPQYCCWNSNFNTVYIESLIDELLKKWKSLNIDGNDESFWRHEWTKHGTCATSSPLLSGQFEYFDKVLQIYDLFPLKSWLSKRGIFASNDRLYSVTEIHYAIEYELKNRIRLECALIPDSAPVLTEIHICLDKVSLKPIDCPQTDDRQCGRRTLLFPSH